MGGGSPSHLGSYVAPCQGHPFFVQPPSPVMGTLPLPAPLTPPPPPTWTGMAASPLRAGVKFSLLKPTGSLELEESFPFSVCLPLCLACALWHVLPGGSLSQRLRAQVRRLPLRPWLPGGGASVLLASSRRLPVYRKRRRRGSSSPGIWWELHQPRTVTQLLGGAQRRCELSSPPRHASLQRKHLLGSAPPPWSRRCQDGASSGSHGGVGRGCFLETRLAKEG